MTRLTDGTGIWAMIGWPKKLLEWARPEKRRPRRTWIEGIRNVVTQRNLKGNDWEDRKNLGWEKRY